VAHRHHRQQAQRHHHLGIQAASGLFAVLAAAQLAEHTAQHAIE
jgi:hypothetical protein